MSNVIASPASPFVPITAAKVLAEKKNPPAPPPPAKTRKNAAVLSIPTGEFTTQTVVDSNKVSYAVAFQFIRKQKLANAIKEVKTVSTGKRGKPTTVYAKA